MKAEAGVKGGVVFAQQFFQHRHQHAAGGFVGKILALERRQAVPRLSMLDGGGQGQQGSQQRAGEYGGVPWR